MDKRIGIISIRNPIIGMTDGPGESMRSRSPRGL
jgi:hypothetical protein